MSDHFVLIDQPDPRTVWPDATPSRRRLGIRRRVLLMVVGGSAIATVGLLAGHVDAETQPAGRIAAHEQAIAAETDELHLIDAATSLYLAAGATIAAAAGLSMGLTRRAGAGR